ncbi:GroES (chaperonin 10)-like protein [Pseudocohnilembus persalinus]|uniref:GroES (Chaperonin 10)-like protein n=1 Tax=Pseudocohnilembus persalinus TaxID=266149 RepID=A0A0V0R458_PSEPJ|nr:GroES (chaperonin 10)-like protein [Pseudocohnilembus persalinus]|eukprot:KRX09013.1 GroES (chaperonin 10)-like protein [Pseudocohnilembus persalinus]
MSQITKTKGVKQEEKGGKPFYGEIDIPELVEGDLLIDVYAAPINPSDQYLIQGIYPEPRKFPGISGIEGSGKVIQAKGQNLQNLVGKNVAFTPKHNQTTGSYGEYAISTEKQVFVLPDNVDLFQGACTYINPFTVVYMLEKVKELGVKTVVHDVGSSALGKQMIKYFSENGVNVINIVRRQEQVEDLKQIGATYILNQSEEGFWERLTKLTQELNATIAFDAIGGEFTSKLIDAMPNHSHIFQYGILGGDLNVNYNTTDLLFKDKHLHGFWLVTEQQNASPEKAQKVIKECTSLVSKTLSSNIVKKFKFEQIEEALEYYSKNMSAGKVLLTKHA